MSGKLRDRSERGQESRLLLVIDGLDEAERSEDPLLALLPRASLPFVRVVYGARPTQYLRHSFYDELDREHRAELNLRGLGRADTRALLAAHVDKYSMEETWIDAVLDSSEGNPLYLRLLCQGLQDGVYRLGDALGL
ncbi:MAG: NACHT domain-containing protein, partial [bacterium]